MPGNGNGGGTADPVAAKHGGLSMIRPTANCSTLDKLVQRAATRASEAEAVSDAAHHKWVRAMRRQRRYELLAHVNREVCGLSDSRQVRGHLLYVGLGGLKSKPAPVTPSVTSCAAYLCDRCLGAGPAWCRAGCFFEPK